VLDLDFNVQNAPFGTLVGMAKVLKYTDLCTRAFNSVSGSGRTLRF
jgi:hypothetical protein